ncbi:head maturation protease, ClpP-related [Micromonospora aurantiaca (nom. illeg.)]|uniref:head maturation protease, ClpP-related n=1 Tax=Micromonospora aurantiaca (nom. illeg.) TaxID=47850 RepID=UPI0033E514F7
MRKQYRFRGSIAPSAAVKRPVRAEVVGTVEDGLAKLHLDDVIDSWGGYWGISAKEFNQALAELGDVDQIHLHINSPGGEVWEGVAILNALRRHPAQVTAIVDGLAASAASFIAVGADRTIMGRNTQMMIHDAWGIGIGPAADMRDLADRLDKISNNIAGMYATKAGGELDGWRDLMVAETWYDAEEAVAAGLADEVEGTVLADEDIVNAFDLSVFKHQGRAQAPDPELPAPELDPEPSAPNAVGHDDGRERRFRFRQRAAARR